MDDYDEEPTAEELNNRWKHDIHRLETNTQNSEIL